jgi:MoxR-like ATPase
MDELCDAVYARTGFQPEARQRTSFNNVYAVGERSLLFTARLRDAHDEPVVRGVLIDRWTTDMVDERADLIPRDIFYHDHQFLLYRCALAYLRGVPLALHGHTGLGKTEAVRYFAAFLCAPLYRMNLHGLSTTDDIIGKLIPVGDSMVGFQDGLVTTAVRRGGILLLEEMNATGQEVWFALHGLLDGSRALVLVENDNQVVRQHPWCQVFSTFNPAEYASLYPGTKELSAAYLRRWASVRVDFPGREAERRILLDRFPEYAEEDLRDVLETMLEVAQVARRLLKDRARAFDYVMSTGTLVSWAEFARDVGALEAARLVFYDLLDQRTKTIFRDQIFAYVTDWSTDQLDLR